MDLMTHIREAFTNLLTAKLRSFLAILGVLVGTGSVVALISSSQLATAHALEQFKTLGTNLLSMSVQQDSGGAEKDRQSLTMKAIPKIAAASPQITEVSPYTSLYQTFIVGNKVLNGQVLGVTETFPNIAKIGLQSGRYISYLDGRAFYCVIGSSLAKKIEKLGLKPIGQQVLVGKYYFTVIGVLDSWQPNFFIFADINDGMMIPIETSYLINPQTQINNVLFRLIKNPKLKVAQDALQQRMKELLPSLKVTFRNPEQIIQIVDKQRKTFTWLLAAIGGISLIVGGIGVMNIMLVSVVERRREIGIRMAIGAKPADILKMFLIESIILTVFGGIFGIIVGVGASFILAIATGWSFYLYILPPILGFLVSVFVGMISGFYPALRASMLDPIQTLQVD